MEHIRTAQKERIERERRKPLREILLELAYVKGMGHAEIAKELGVPSGTIASWFGRQGIQAGRLARMKAKELLAVAPDEP